MGKNIAGLEQEANAPDIPRRTPMTSARATLPDAGHHVLHDYVGAACVSARRVMLLTDKTGVR
jgi:hypothetical protein